MINKLYIYWKQFIKFGLVGCSNTLIALGIYSLLVYLGFYYQIGNVVAFLVSSVTGFLLNKFWVFKATETKTVHQLVKYYIVYCSSLLISMVLSFLWIDIIKLNAYIAPIINLAITVPYNYKLSRIWVYMAGKREN